MEKLEETVLEYYEKGGSVKYAARMSGISEYKAQQILSNYGVVTSETAQTALKLYEEGKSHEEIAKIMGITENGLRRYLPYTRGPKNKDNPTINAVRIRKCREKKKGREA